MSLSAAHLSTYSILLVIFQQSLTEILGPSPPKTRMSRPATNRCAVRGTVRQTVWRQGRPSTQYSLVAMLVTRASAQPADVTGHFPQSRITIRGEFICHRSRQPTRVDAVCTPSAARANVHYCEQQSMHNKRAAAAAAQRPGATASALRGGALPCREARHSPPPSDPLRPRRRRPRAAPADQRRLIKQQL